MTEKDIIFKFYKQGDRPNLNCFCHYGWDGKGAFAFWRYAQSYYGSAEILFEKFVQAKGDYAVLDGIGLTISFLYRHFVELTVKYLYIKYGVRNDEAKYKSFIAKGHGLNKLWGDTRAIIKPLKDRVGSKVNLECLDHYIHEVEKFDKNEEAMRYPIKNNLKQMHGPTHLDIYNLHDRMRDLFNAFDTLDHDIDNQLFDDVPQEKITAFLSKYNELRSRVLWFLDASSQIDKKGDKGLAWLSLSDIKMDNTAWAQQTELFKSCTDDELIMLDTLYYTGQYIRGGQLRLPQKSNDAQVDAVKQCIINMTFDHVEFGRPRNEMISIDVKSTSAILRCVPYAVSVFDWDRPDVLEIISGITQRTDCRIQ